jgi:hypothetical protein
LQWRLQIRVPFVVACSGVSTFRCLAMFIDPVVFGPEDSMNTILFTQFIFYDGCIQL